MKEENPKMLDLDLNDPRWLHTAARRAELCRRYNRGQRIRAGGGFLAVALLLGLLGRKWLALSVLITAPIVIFGAIRYTEKDIER